MTLAKALAERARERSSPSTIPLVRGRVFPVHLLPDPAVADRLTIGVAFVDAAEVVHCRLADDFSRLRCLYDDRVDIESFTMLRDMVEAELSGTLHTSPLPQISENIEYGTPWPAAGFSVDEILKQSFATLVPFGASRGTGAKQGVPVKNEELRKRVFRILRERFGNEIEPMLKGAPIRVGSRARAGHPVHLPLHDARTGRAADIVSAFTANAETVVRNLTRSVANLLAVRVAESQRTLGLFVLEPSEDSFPGRDLRSVRQHVADLADLAAGAGVDVEVRQSEEALADAVGQWQRAA